jgi:hypothetical protein
MRFSREQITACRLSCLHRNYTSPQIALRIGNPVVDARRAFPDFTVNRCTIYPILIGDCHRV